MFKRTFLALAFAGALVVGGLGASSEALARGGCGYGGGFYGGHGGFYGGYGSYYVPRTYVYGGWGGHHHGFYGHGHRGHGGFRLSIGF